MRAAPAIAFALVTLAACGAPLTEGPTCPGFGEASATTAVPRAGAAVPADPLVGDIADSLGRAIDASRARAGTGYAALRAKGAATFRLDVLAITTGGQNGAFAAGVLSGWADKPDFGVVTGASAGGLIAPVAFAGPAFDGRLSAFSGIGEGQVVRRRPFFGLFSDAVYSTEPLEARVENAYDDALLARIEERSEAGGLLFLGATDLRTSRFERFDVRGMIRRTSGDRTRQKACLAAAALATSAIPAAFPPRPVNGRPYTDAGVRQHVFLEGVGRAVEEIRERRNVEIEVAVWLLVNHDLTFDDRPVPRTLLPLALRNADIVGDEGMRASIRRALQLSRDEGWAVRALAIPSDFDPGAGCDGERALFSACYTRALFEAGRSAGAEGTDWMDAAALARRVATGKESG